MYNASIYTSAHKGSMAKSCTDIRTKRQIGIDPDGHIERWTYTSRDKNTNGHKTETHKDRWKNYRCT